MHRYTEYVRKNGILLAKPCLHLESEGTTDCSLLWLYLNRCPIPPNRITISSRRHPPPHSTSWCWRLERGLKARFGKGRKQSVNRELPFLPSAWSHALTPSPSKEVSTAGSGFFEKIPTELRQEILILAFGNGVVYMDLSLVNPIAPFPRWARPRSSHAGIYVSDRG